MPRVNLLPWREELRKQRRKEFGVMAALVALAMGGVIIAAHLHVEEMIRYQNQRNDRIDQEIRGLDKKIAEIQNLERERDNLLARMRIVEQLQTSRPEVVHLFDELAKALPEGVYLTSMRQTGRNVRLDGFAQSNARVSSFMRALDASDWLTNPDLKMIQAAEQKSFGGTRLSRFSLDVQQAVAKTDSEAD